MKLSWSYRIAALYIGFVGIIVTMIIIASNNKEELVAKDYYAQELNFQQKIDAAHNEQSLSQSINHEVNEKDIVLDIPVEWTNVISGEIYFYCPSNSKNDLELKMEFDQEGRQIIAKSRLRKGTYKMRLSWVNEKTKFFKEEVITIN